MTSALLFSALSENGGQAQAGFYGFPIDAATDAVAITFQAVTADPITHLGYRSMDRTGTPPAQIIGLEGRNSSGFPDGTYLGGGTPASKIYTPPADSSWNGTWQWIALDNPYTPSRGQFLTMTVRYSSGTVNGSNCSGVFYTHGIRKLRRGFPKPMLCTAGTWANSNAPAAYGYKTASGVYGQPCGTVSAGTAATTSGHRRTNYFTLPAGFGDTFQIAGVCFEFQIPAASGTTKVGIWNAAGTELSSVTMDTDDLVVNSSDGQVECYFQDSTLPTLVFGTKYYIGVECLSSVSVNSRYVTMTNANDINSVPLGANIGYASWNGSTWIEDALSYIPMRVIFSDITEPGGVIQPFGGLIKAA